MATAHAIHNPQRMDGRAAIGTRTAELGRIDAFSQFTATYAWTPPAIGVREMHGVVHARDWNYRTGRAKRAYDGSAPHVQKLSLIHI